MIRNWTLIKVLALAAILFTACTQDELAEQGNTLPDGEYPLQIGSVSITAEASEEPWTRVTEKPDGSGSVFQGGERIGVRIGDNEETGVYIIKVDDAGNVTVEPDKPVYWKNTQTADVTAWYPADRSSVDLGFQLLNNTMTYVLHGTGTGNHQSPVTLKFTHQLAKVRVVAKGTAEVRDISIWNVPRICYIDEGKITGLDNISTGGIPMLRVEREGIGTCWEASVGPGIEIQKFNIDAMDCDLTSSVTTQAGALHTITITANNEGTQPIDLSTLTDTHEINDNGTYYVTGTGQYGIRVTNGNPDIYLEDAQISVSSGNAIDITSGNPTIHVKGNDNEVSSSDGAGIYVAGSSTVTITGNGREDKLTVRGGAGSSGIGGYLSREDPAPACGNIEITSVWIEAYGSKSINFEVAPGIGGAGSASCGTITIDDATVYAYGIEAFPIGSSSAIGGGFDIREKKGSFGTITIRNNSEVYVQRGDSYSDYIGNSGSMTYPETGDIVATVDETSKVTKQN